MQFSLHLFILLLGFVLGNLFPTFFGDFLGKVGTPVFLFVALDFFNYFYYTDPFRAKRDRRSVQGPVRARSSVWSEAKGPGYIFSKTKGTPNGASTLSVLLTEQTGAKLPDPPGVMLLPTSWWWGRSSFSTRANSLKIGFLFGLFVDAFKVGS